MHIHFCFFVPLYWPNTFSIVTLFIAELIPKDLQPPIFTDPAIAAKASNLGITYDPEEAYKTTLSKVKIHADNKEQYIGLIQLMYDYYMRNKVQPLSLRMCSGFLELIPCITSDF